jgi:deazaflavin-dependent oxidoreductase (nitroreductase family)
MKPGSVWSPLIRLKQWLYRGGRPNWIAVALNRFSAALHALGIAPNYLVTLEVRGRRSGRMTSLPLVMIVDDGKRYLVSMLGAEADWVRNVKAAAGNVTLRHGRREQVHLEEVPPERRAPLLKLYLKRAPGARPHVPVHKDAPLSEFEKIATHFPVFRVVTDNMVQVSPRVAIRRSA